MITKFDFHSAGVSAQGQTKEQAAMLFALLAMQYEIELGYMGSEELFWMGFYDY